MEQSASRVRALSFVVAAALFGAWIAWTIRVASPVVNAAGVDSDVAVSALMANADRLTPLHAYYWGQDRLGTWPLVLAWLLGKATGLGLGPRGLGAMLDAGLALGAVAMWRATRSSIVLVAWASAMILPVGTRFVLDHSQPYGWQLAVFPWVWLLVRRGLEGPRSTGREAGLFALAFGLIQPHPLGYVLAALALAAEVARRGRRPTFAELLPLARPVGGAIALVLVLAASHAGYARAQGVWVQQLRPVLDRGHLLENAAAQLRVLGTEQSLVWLGLALVLGGAWWITRPRVASDLALAGTLFLLAALAAALPNVLVSWVRSNAYAPRYSTLVCFFLVVSVLASGAAWMARIGLQSSLIERSVGAVLAVALAVFVGTRPAAASGPHPVELAANALQQKAPGAVLLGSYWGTYTFIAPAAEKPLVPVLGAFDHNRTPWTIDALSGGDRGHRLARGDRAVRPRERSGAARAGA